MFQPCSPICVDAAELDVLDLARIDLVALQEPVQHLRRELVGRMVPMVAGWPETVAGTTIDRQCGSSMQTNFNAAAAIWAGRLDMVVSAGVEMMSRVPMGSNGGDLSDKLLDRWRIVPQGISAEVIAEEWGLTREELDAFSWSRTDGRSRLSTRAASRTRSFPSR